MAGEYKYRAFLSYSHDDRKWADWLHRALERYRVPPHLRQASRENVALPRNLCPIFRDREELPSASNLPSIIQKALADSESLIVICSPSAAKSRWVDDEVRRFQELGRGGRILCIIFGGDPLARDGSGCFPPSLRHPVDSLGRPLAMPEEPIAADARGGRTERERAKFMLIAGLLGVGLDELLQRDLHRRHRNMFAMATGAMLLAVIMAGLTVFAFLAQAESERRRADAENLVGFMLGDLREDLHSIGRLDLYSSVADQAMEYFRSLGEADARDEVIAQRALALRQIGTARLDLGDMAGALGAYGEALQISKAVAARNPNRTDWQLALAESHFAVGEVYWQRGDYAAAGAKFMEQLALVDAMVEANPSDVELLGHAGYAWTNYGRILERSEKLAEARTAYEKVMDIFRQLMALKPHDVEVVLEVGFAHNNLGKLSMAQGLLDEAEMHFQTDLEIKLSIHQQDPVHNLWRDYLAASHFWLGRLLQSRAFYSQALRHGESSLALLDALLLTDPAMTPWRQRRAAVEHLLATVCRLREESGCAESYIESSLSDLDQLITANPENAIWQRANAFSSLEAAWQAAVSGDRQRAWRLAEGAMQAATGLVKQAPADRDAWKLEALARLTLGDLASLDAQPETAMSSWQSAQHVLEESLAGSTDPEVLDILALLLVRHGRMDKAKEIRGKLDEMGYYTFYPQLEPALHRTVADRS